MVHIKDGLLTTVCVLVIFLLQTHFRGAQSQQTGPPQSVMVMVGEDAVLPCQLEPPVDAVSMTMEWGRPDLDPRFVFLWHDRQELLIDQNKAYKGRASLSVSRLQHGDLSLKLSNVNVYDNGKYRCYIPKLRRESFVELLVGAASSPGISLAGIHKATGGVVLQCGSAGWYPEPEVFWLDGEGNLLSIGPTETVRGPDDLYTVSSRVTVEKRHNNNFTCRVHQKNINQTRETHIHVPEDFFMSPSSGCSASVTMSVLFGLMFLLTVVFLVWKWREIQKKTGTKMEGEESREQLLEKTKLKEELEKTEEEVKDLTHVIKTLKEVWEKLWKQKEELKVQKEKVEELVKENEKKMDSVEKEVTEKKGDISAKAQGYLKLKEIIQEAKWKLEERVKEHEQLSVIVEEIASKIFDEVNKSEGKNNKAENHMKEIRKQMEEMEKKVESKKGEKK